MKRFLTLFLVLGVVCTACKKDNDPSLILNIEEEFSINLWEELGQNSRDFQLNLLTIKKNFKCQNYEVGFEQSQTGNNLFVTINDIIEPTDCLSGENKAAGNVDFGKLSAGFYNLKINLKDQVTNEGLLEVKEDYYQISMNSKDGIAIDNNRLNRVPDRLIWGFVQYKDENITNAFLEEIATFTNSVDLLDGNYGHFNLENSNLTMPIEIAPSTATNFVFSLTGTSVELQNLVKKYQEEYGNGLAVKVFTYRGEEF